jgi:zinc protease
MKDTTFGRPMLAVTLGLFMLLARTPDVGAAPAVPEKALSIEGITEYRLDNGLRVLLFPDPSTSAVTVNITVFVGSRREGYGETGMAHLLEHMLFKGTPSHAHIPQALRDHGASTFNGTTWVDRTNYYETMPATDANLEFALGLEADRLVHSLVRREDLLSEMTVVRNEFEMGENDPQHILNQRMMAVAYEWHNYGKSTIGNRSDIERVPIEKLQAFYRKYYQPDNALLIIAGRFDEKRALGWVGQYFGALPRPSRQLDQTYTEEPPQDGERTVVLRRVGSAGVVGSVYHIPSGSHADYPALEVLKEALVTEPSGRLYQALVTSKKAGSVSGTATAYHDPGVLELFAELDAKQSLDDARQTLVGVVEHLAKEPISVEEVERAKRRLLKNAELLWTQSNRMAIELSEWAALGDWRLFFLHRDRLRQVTPDDVARVAGRYLMQSNRTVGLFIPTEHPERAAIPPPPAVEEILKNYRGSRTLAEGEAFEPTPEHIEKRLQRATLPGGVKVALLPKKTRGEAVLVDLTLHYGNEESLRGYPAACDLLASMMLRGTKRHNRQQLQDELDRLKARLVPQGGLGQIGFSIRCQRASLPAVLRLLGEVLREPTFPQQEFDVLQRQYHQALDQGRTEPESLAHQTLRRKLNPYPKEDVRYEPTIEEEIALFDRVTTDQLRRLYTEQVGATAGECVIVGDFDPAAARDVLGDLLKDWKSSVAYRRVPKPAHLEAPGSRQEILTPDKANAVYMAGMGLMLGDTDPDFPALEVANFAFGGASLASRLANRIRQKEGLSYGVGSSLSASALERSGRLMLYAICNPQNMDKVDRGITEELDRLVKDGLDEKELAGTKKAYVEQLKAQRANDAAVAALLSENLQAERTFAYEAELEQKIAALTVADVNAAIRRQFVPGRLVVVRAGDFKKEAGARR